MSISSSKVGATIWDGQVCIHCWNNGANDRKTCSQRMGWVAEITSWQPWYGGRQCDDKSGDDGGSKKSKIW